MNSSVEGALAAACGDWIVAAALLVLGIQVIFSSFLLSILGLRGDST